MPDFASPRGRRLAAPRWLDTRLVLGILLVLISVVIGAKVIAGADAYSRVYAVTGDLAAGTALTRSDISVVKVRFGDSGDRYISADGAAPVGYVVARAMGRGELLPRASVVSAAQGGDVRLVTVPVAAHHFVHGLAHGQLVDVYVTPTARGASKAGTPALVLSRATVDSVSDVASSRLSSTAEAAVTLLVPAAHVEAVVAAVQSGPVDMVGIPPGAVAGSTPSAAALPGTLTAPSAGSSPAAAPGRLPPSTGSPARP